MSELYAGFGDAFLAGAGMFALVLAGQWTGRRINRWRHARKDRPTPPDKA